MSGGTALGVRLAGDQMLLPKRREGLRPVSHNAHTQLADGLRVELAENFATRARSAAPRPS